MKTREELIDEMAKAMGDFELEDTEKCDIELSEHLFAKGYRKQSDTVREFVERLKEENEISLRRYGKGIGMTAIFRIADEMKFELFKQQEDNNG